MRLTRLKQRWTRFTATSGGARLVKGVRLLFVAGVVAFLVSQLSNIGWGEIARSLPSEPLFYIILLAMYLLLPVSEAVIYSRLWSLGFLHSIAALFRKRILNADVLGYSGEVYLYVWARDRLSRPRSEIMAAIKDNLIVSSVMSISAAVLLLTLLLTTGQIALGDFMENPSPVYLAVGIFVAVLAAAAGLRFRRVIFSLRRKTLAFLAGIHMTRFLLGYVLQVLQWWVVIPDAPFQTWALLLTVLVVINRIPFVPSRDLIFVGAGASLSPLLAVPVAPVVGMLLVRSAVDRLLNAGVFGLSLLLEPDVPAASAGGNDVPEPRITPSQAPEEDDVMVAAVAQQD